MTTSVARGPESVCSATSIPSGAPIYIGATRSTAASLSGRDCRSTANASHTITTIANSTMLSGAGTAAHQQLNTTAAITTQRESPPTRFARSGRARSNCSVRSGRTALVMRTYSSAASPATTHARRRNPTNGRRKIAASAAAANSTPLITRVIRASGKWSRMTPDPISLGAGLAGTQSRIDADVAPLALLVRENRFEQVPASEVGPERLGYVDLRVRDLPQQVVADAHFAARANQQIRIRLTRGVEEAGKTLLVELLGPDASL